MGGGTDAMQASPYSAAHLLGGLRYTFECAHAHSTLFIISTHPIRICPFSSCVRSSNFQFHNALCARKELREGVGHLVDSIAVANNGEEVVSDLSVSVEDKKDS